MRRDLVLAALSVFVFTVSVGLAQIAVIPQITDVAPDRAPSYGGFKSSVFGQGFQSGSRVYFGTIPAESITFISASQLDVVTPFSPRGVVDLVVTNPDGKSAALPHVFEFFYEGDGIFEVRGDNFPSNVEDTVEIELGDMDGDGDLDVFTTNFLEIQPGEPHYRLCLNNGSGIFTDATATSLPSVSYASDGAALGDADGDGSLDIFLVSWGQLNRLYLNDGHGVFTDVTLDRLPLDNDGSVDAEFGDIDGDGDLDILVAKYGSQNHLYLNDGLGFFTDVTASHLPIEKSGSEDAEFGDVNGDGMLDILVANYGQQNLLFMNDGTGRFVDATFTNLPLENDWSADAELADVDRDGDLDLFIANLGAQNRLYVNDGSGVFFDATESRLPPDNDSSGGAALGDVDGDGHLDILIANWGQQNRLYLNNGNGVFTDQSMTHMPSDADWSADNEVGDVDGDGDLDFVFANNGRNHVYTNVKGTRLPDTATPTVPTELTATAVSCSHVDLSWQASTDNIAVTGYTIFRDGMAVGTSSTTRYSDMGLPGGATFCYTVDAHDAAGNPSEQTGQVCTPAPVCCTDGDGDGYAFQGGACGPVDCDDQSPDIHPGSTEICGNSLDEDCDGYAELCTMHDVAVISLRLPRKMRNCSTRQKVIRAEVGNHGEFTEKIRLQLTTDGIPTEKIVYLDPGSVARVAFEFALDPSSLASQTVAVCMEAFIEQQDFNPADNSTCGSIMTVGCP